MSLVKLQSSLLTLGPRVWTEGKRLHIRNNLLLRCLTLFTHVHTVVVDTDRKRVEVRKRWLWLWQRERHVPFDAIAHLDYRYHSLATSLTAFWQTADRLESFSIELVLRDGTRVPVCRFRGEGTAMTGWSGVFLGDQVIDSGGIQEDASRNLVELLTATLDVPLGERLLGRHEERIMVCERCDRHLTAGEAFCPMCGGRSRTVG